MRSLHRGRAGTPLRTRWLGSAALAIATPFVVSAFTARAAAEPGIIIDDRPHLIANLRERKLYIQVGDDIVETYPIAIGIGSKPTPAGDYTIRRIVWNPAWIPPNEKWAEHKKPEAPGAAANPMKVVKIFFKEPDYYIHGTGDVESLGEAASHGCLRMDPDDAYRVARYLMDHGGQPRDESWFWRVLHVRSETKTVYLNSPIPITVVD